MKLLKNNLTFAIINDDRTWRFDITERFCEYYSYIINDNFRDNIIIADDVDSAIEECKTDYLIIQRAGNIICDFSVFTSLDSCIQTNPSIFYGYIRDFEDYAIVDPRFIFINKKIWHFSGHPKYIESSKSSFFFTREIEKSSKMPFIVKMKKKDENKMLVPSSCLSRGAALIAKQLDMYEKVIPIQQIVSPNSIFYLDGSSSYNEIVSETYFEKNILEKYKRSIHFTDATPFEIKTKSISPTAIFSPSRGLRAVTLADTFKPKKIIVFDSNPMALELQKRIFSIDTPKTYTEILNDFANDFPNVSMPSTLGHNAHTVIPKTDCTVDFALVDVTSFEVEKMLAMVNIKDTVLFDFGDCFVQPYNFYKRPLYQVQGLFSELFSFMKSRPGPSHVFGFAPGFEQVDDLDINGIRKIKMETDSEVDIYETPFQFIPQNSIPPDKYEVPAFEPLIRENAKEQNTPVSSVIKKIVNAPLIGKILDKKIPAKKQEDSKPQPAPTKPQPSPTKPQPVPQPIKAQHVSPKAPNKISPEYEELEKKIDGFKYTLKNSEDKNLIIFEKTVELNTFSAVYEYIFDKKDTAWKFNCSKVGGNKKVTFSSGVGLEGLYRHIALPTKFNKHAAEKFL